jgi:predicted Zn finger-like uncharacterized protein
MIISCPSCNKNFEISSGLIPDSGRLLLCGSCNNEWFFTKGKKQDSKTQSIGEIEIPNQDSKTQSIGEIEIPNQDSKTQSIGEIEIPNQDSKTQSIGEKPKNKNSISMLSLLLVFIISSIAIIILVDTFKSQISSVVPNIELILFNLYETLKDIVLFFKDLIR